MLLWYVVMESGLAAAAVIRCSEHASELNVEGKLNKAWRQDTADPATIESGLLPLPSEVSFHHADGSAFHSDRMREDVKAVRVDPHDLYFDYAGGTIPDSIAWSLKHFCTRATSQHERASSVHTGQPQASSSDIENSGILERIDVRCDERDGVAGGVPTLGMNEEYTLRVGPDAPIDLTASTRHGLNRGLETLLQVIRALVDIGVRGRRDTVTSYRVGQWPGRSSSGSSVTLAITDRPRFKWRGILVDSARHFTPVPLLARILKEMAHVKLNVLHWHLTDAVAFPLDLLDPSLQRLPVRDAKAPDERYSTDAVAYVVELASNLSIRVVPEIDMPAHTASWGGMQGIVTPCDSLKPLAVSDWGNRFKALDLIALNPAASKTMNVVRRVLDDVMTLFPDEYVHVGGDEVDFRCWLSHAPTVRWLRSQNLSPEDALRLFFQEVFDVVTSRGRKPMVWQEAFDLGMSLPAGAVVQPWKCWSEGSQGMLGHATSAAALRSGDDLGVVSSTCLYLDWDSQWDDFIGHPPHEGLPDFNRGKDNPLDRLYGGELALWTERIDFTNAECRLWPRSAAGAEMLWSERKLTPQDVYKRLYWYTMDASQRGIRLTPQPMSDVGGSGGDFQQPIDDNDDPHEVVEAALHDIRSVCPLLQSQSTHRPLSLFDQPGFTTTEPTSDRKPDQPYYNSYFGLRDRSDL